VNSNFLGEPRTGGIFRSLNQRRPPP
jgi:hypothetical protein